MKETPSLFIVVYFHGRHFKPPILNEIHIYIPEHALLTIMISSFGCGKSTLLRGFLGETSLFEGMVTVRQRDIAFCDQTPWIIIAPVQENGIGHSAFDSAW